MWLALLQRKVLRQCKGHLKVEESAYHLQASITAVVPLKLFRIRMYSPVVVVMQCLASFLA